MSRFLAGLDSCIFIEAARDPSGLCQAILTAAKAGVLEVLVAPKTVEEVERNLGDSDSEHFLASCRRLWLVCDAPSELQILEDTPKLLPLMHHVEDVPIAIAMRHSALRPRAFVTSNARHWDPVKLNGVLGTLVLNPGQFLHLLGVPRPPRKLREKQ